MGVLLMSDLIFALDPGPHESGWVLYERRKVLDFGKGLNIGIMQMIRADGQLECTPSNVPHPATMTIEMIACYGMRVGSDIFETCTWIGAFEEGWRRRHHGELSVRLYRRDVKKYVCDSYAANDADVRAALIDRYGGKAAAIGLKATPGPLYGMKADMWQALALAVTYDETRGEG